MYSFVSGPVQRLSRATEEGGSEPTTGVASEASGPREY